MANIITPDILPILPRITYIELERINDKFYWCLTTDVLHISSIYDKIQKTNTKYDDSWIYMRSILGASYKCFGKPEEMSYLQLRVKNTSPRQTTFRCDKKQFLYIETLISWWRQHRSDSEM
jgi:hypothetical protein